MTPHQLTAIVFVLILNSGCVELKTAGKQVGHTTREVTREVGHTTRDAAKAVGHTSKEAAKKVGKSVSNATSP